MRISDWSSDVCSSDLLLLQFPDQRGFGRLPRFDLAAGKFPEMRHRLARRALLQQHAAIRVDQSGGDHRSEEHTSELQSLMRISYAVFCLKKKNEHISLKHHSTNIQTH